MTHLVILQKGVEDGGSVENVSASVISALYNISKDSSLVYESTDLQGDLQCNATYLRYIDSLHTQYPKLNITALSYYMFFLDPYMELFWANSEYGDGSGISAASALSATKFPSSGNGYSYNNIPFGQFYNNTDVTSFDELGLFTNITEIPQGCFCKASNFTSIDLTNITTLGACAFRNSGLSGAVNIPNFRTFKLEVNSAPNDMRGSAYYFENCPITSVNLGSNVSSGLKITSVPLFCFSGCTSLTSVTGLDECTYIASSAFKNCSSLQSLPDLNSNLNEISYDGFSGCSNLLCIDITNVGTLLNSAFGNCTSLLALDTNDPSEVNTRDTYTLNVSTLNNNVFSNCKLTNKNLICPNASGVSGLNGTGIKSLKALNATYCGSFSNCPNLEKVELGNITSLAAYTFYGLGNLKEVHIASETISYNSTLDMIDLSWPLVTMPTECFLRCPSLYTTLTIKDSNDLDITKPVNWKFPNCTTVERNSFNGGRVKSYEFPALTSLWSSVFQGNTSLTRIVIPNITHIYSYTFDGCTNLTDVQWSSQLTTVEKAGFKNCGFTGILDLPATLVKLEYEAFLGCNNLTGIIIRATTPPDVTGYSFPNLFSGNNVLRKIYVPDASLSDYQTAWTDIKQGNTSIVGALDVISNVPSS